MGSWRRRFVIGTGAVVAFGALVQALEVWDVHRQREARSALGDRLYSEVRGDGPPVVFLAGFEGTTRYWDGALDGLASDRRLIFVDALGFGRSPWPDVGYTLDDHLGALERTLHGLNVKEHVTLVGHSFGTILAAHYAARHPSEVERLVLLGTPVFDSPAEARSRIGALSPLAAVFALNRPLAAVSCMLVCAFRPLFQRIAPLLVPDLPREVAEDSILHDWQSFDGTLRNILLTQPIAKPLEAVGSKVTFVHGDSDPVTPLDRIRALTAATGGRLVVVQGDHQHYLHHRGELEKLILTSTSTAK